MHNLKMERVFWGNIVLWRALFAGLINLEAKYCRIMRQSNVCLWAPHLSSAASATLPGLLLTVWDPKQLQRVAVLIYKMTCQSTSIIFKFWHRQIQSWHEHEDLDVILYFMRAKNGEHVSLFSTSLTLDCLQRLCSMSQSLWGPSLVHPPQEEMVSVLVIPIA